MSGSPEGGATLVLEASTYRASVALIARGVVVAEREVPTGRSEHEHLMPAVAAVLEEGGVTVSSLARVVCGAGPGSFTSLRIAAALGKGLVSGSHAGGPRLASVPSLALIVAGAAERLAAGVYLASVDALRGERHAALVTLERGDGDAMHAGPMHAGPMHAMPMGAMPIRVVPMGAARRLPDQAVSDWARAAGAAMIGPGCALDAWPAARGVVLVGDAVRDVDLDSWEPDYGRLAEAEVRRLAAAAGQAATGQAAGQVAGQAAR
jgi:tRNA threonylcarbamoyladenosine biosynthesis protein TsaB